MSTIQHERGCCCAVQTPLADMCPHTGVNTRVEYLNGNCDHGISERRYDLVAIVIDPIPCMWS